MLDEIGYALVFATVAVVFWQPFGDNMIGARQTSSPLPVGLFGPIWLGLYTLISINIVHYVSNPAVIANQSTYIAALVLILFNLAFNKSWPYVFFAWRAVWLAAAIALAIFGTAVALAIVELLGGEPWWSPAFLLGPYILWSLFATLLTIWIGITGCGRAHPPPSVARSAAAPAARTAWDVGRVRQE